MPAAYSASWNPAEKPGYAGTAIFSKQRPLGVCYTDGHETYDGRRGIL